MTPKERMLTAMQRGKPDRVPCAPDISTMIPQRLTGKPFWEIEMNHNPPLWRAYIDAVKYYGIDGWFIYGGLNWNIDSKLQYRSEVVSRTDERLILRHFWDSPSGPMTGETTYYVADSATATEKPIKNLKEEREKLQYFYPRILDADPSPLAEMRSELGDLGAFGICIGYPGFQSWFGLVQDGLEELTYTYADNHEIIEEWREIDHNYCVRQMEFILDAKPDFVILGGSGSITMQSPAIFKELSVPTIKELTRMAKQAGIPTMIHSCGKQRDLVEILAVESDLDCVNPLETPPMGDCDLAELKHNFGGRFSLFGNIHTTDVMLRGSLEDVERAARKCIDDTAEGGGFILSTGDQCGRDTPDENIRKLVEVAKTYGRY